VGTSYRGLFPFLVSKVARGDATDDGSSAPLSTPARNEQKSRAGWPALT
jgi:hypothetical protein